MPTVSAPAYYEKFQCIGSQCEDTCCAGWSVPIDEATHQRYVATDDAVLQPLLRLALPPREAGAAPATQPPTVLRMRADRSCHFLQDDKLCAIQARLGEDALSHTCRSYPRCVNEFGDQREHALGISCPEAARLVLLPEAPMHFVALEVPGSPSAFTNFRFPLPGPGDADQIAVLNTLRALIIAILQCRAMGLGARMMLLGWLLEDAQAVLGAAGFRHAAELLPVLEAINAMLARPQDLEQQFKQVPADTARRLQTMAHFIDRTLAGSTTPRYRACLMAAYEGLMDPATAADASGSALLAHFQHSYVHHYLPFMRTHAHVLEHYLVNMAITELFPFVGDSFLNQFRKMVFNVSVLQMLLVGIAARHQGLSEAWVVQLFQSFSRKSDHNPKHLDTLREALQPAEGDSFAHILWMLQEPALLA